MLKSGYLSLTAQVPDVEIASAEVVETVDPPFNGLKERPSKALVEDLWTLDLEAETDVDQGTAEEPGKVADIFIASKLFENLFEIAMRKMKKEMLEDASFKEKMEDQPELLSKIKEKF